MVMLVAVIFSSILFPKMQTWGWAQPHLQVNYVSFVKVRNIHSSTVISANIYRALTLYCSQCFICGTGLLLYNYCSLFTGTKKLAHSHRDHECQSQNVSRGILRTTTLHLYTIQCLRVLRDRSQLHRIIISEKGRIQAKWSVWNLPITKFHRSVLHHLLQVLSSCFSLSSFLCDSSLLS